MAGAGAWEWASCPGEYQTEGVTETKRVRVGAPNPFPPRAGVLSANSPLPEELLLKEYLVLFTFMINLNLNLVIVGLG